MACSKPNVEERRLLVVGKTGHGKSSTGNSLLGSERFKTSFFSESETSTCSYETTSLFGRKLVVVDTPGFFDTRIVNDEICKEFIRACSLVSPGFHAIFLVLKAGERLTVENKDAVQKYFKLFGKEVEKYMFLIVTHWDMVPSNCESLDDYLKHGSKDLQDIREMCKGGACTINNNAKPSEMSNQVRDIALAIETNLHRLSYKHFSNKVFRDLELYYSLHEKFGLLDGTVESCIRCIGYMYHWRIDTDPSTDEESEAPHHMTPPENIDYGKRHQVRRIIAAEKKGGKGIFSTITAVFLHYFDIRKLFSKQL